MFNFDDQGGSVFPKSSMVNISLDGRFLAVNVTPNPCPWHVCLMSVTMLMTIAENSDGSNASYR